MLIPITVNLSCENPKLPSGLAKISHDEIVLIELQGSLDVECNHPSERNGKMVGKLTLDEPLKKPTLLIGNHLLEGKIATLVKPLAVLRKQKVSKPSGFDEMECDSEEQSVAEEGASTGWDVAGIVKKKIVFSKRPMPVIGRQL